VLAQLDANELGLDHLGLLGHQVVNQAVAEGRLFEREGLDTQLVLPAGEAVLTGVQHTFEIAIAQQQAALVLLHSDTREHHRCPSSFHSMWNRCRYSTAVDVGCQGSDTTAYRLRLPPSQAKVVDRGREAPPARRAGGRADEHRTFRLAAIDAGPTFGVVLRPFWTLVFQASFCGTGIEPATYALTMRCSTRLSYPVAGDPGVEPGWMSQPHHHIGRFRQRGMRGSDGPFDIGPGNHTPAG
jgi:hypothetical protein